MSETWGFEGHDFIGSHIATQNAGLGVDLVPCVAEVAAIEDTTAVAYFAHNGMIGTGTLADVGVASLLCHHADHLAGTLSLGNDDLAGVYVANEVLGRTVGITGVDLIPTARSGTVVDEHAVWNLVYYGVVAAGALTDVGVTTFVLDQGGGLSGTW